MDNNRTSINVWIEKTIVKGRLDRVEGERALGEALWSPKTGSDGRNTYKNMPLVRIGDLILHLVDNSRIIGLSLVEKEALETTGLDGTQWDRPSYLIRLKRYTELDKPVERNDLLIEKNKSLLNNIAKNSEVFYNSDLTLRQGGYLTPCPIELLSLINDCYKNYTKNNLPFLDELGIVFDEIQIENVVNQIEFNYRAYHNIAIDLGLNFTERIVIRFVTSICTKPFLILSGLSGSSKTKLAQSFVQWICDDKSQYRIIPVGADWTNREPLLGYPNALKPEEYVKPDSGVLDLIIQANNQPELPHFLILDEMNLSHVERYFADFLSVMESKEEIPLHSGKFENGVPAKLKVPSNLFIIGTVNIDETTNMFSPKVLDRANTIEFRVSQDEMQNFLSNIKEINMEALTGKGAGMAKSFLDLAANKNFVVDDDINAALVKFFGELKKTGAEFGYRSATEILRLIHQLSALDANMTKEQKIDIAIMQKLLPKLHGSRRKLCPVLETLGSFCISGDIKIVKDVFEKDDFDFNSTHVIYPLSLEKIARMYRGAIDNGFASFAEA
jgi:hypothetical protein